MGRATSHGGNVLVDDLDGDSAEVRDPLCEPDLSTGYLPQIVADNVLACQFGRNFSCSVVFIKTNTFLKPTRSKSSSYAPMATCCLSQPNVTRREIKLLDG